jgi:hypothetical protein
VVVVSAGSVVGGNITSIVTGGHISVVSARNEAVLAP